jgi:hypothetical protein
MQLFNKKGIYNFYFFIYCLIYDFFTFLGFSNLELNRRELKKNETQVYNNLYYFKFKEQLLNFVFSENFLKIDYFSFFFNKPKFYKYFQKNKIFRSYFRILSCSNGFYFNFKNFNNKNNFLFFLKNSLFSGFKFL